MAGLDLPVKLRRGIGNGNVVPEDELVRRLKPFDQDNDGALTVTELAEFFKESQVGGPWFCQTVAKTMWRMAEERWAKPIQMITIEALARVVHFSMSQPPRREKRYVITPEGLEGKAPARTVGAAGTGGTGGTGGAPKTGARAGGAEGATGAGGSASGSGGSVPRKQVSASPRAAASSTGVGMPRRIPRAVPRRPGPKPRQ